MKKEISIKMLFALMLISFTFLLQANAQQVRTITVEGHDDKHYSVEKIMARPGERIRVVMKTISNFPKTIMAHDWVLLKPGVDAQAFVSKCSTQVANGYFDPGLKDQVIAKTALVGRGEQDEVTFNAPEKTGNYLYVCTYPGHFEAGMKGTLVVSK